jgi:transcriptional repressor NrdR
MRCPSCGTDKDKVVDSRAGEKGHVIRRRRECLHCGRRFTTYERVEEQVKITVVKKDRTRVPFNREKLLGALRKACYKRPVSESRLIALSEVIEETIVARHDKEVESETIGLIASDHLQKVDQLAYVRFASAYKQFRNAGDLMEELKNVIDRPVEAEDQGKLF